MITNEYQKYVDSTKQFPEYKEALNKLLRIVNTQNLDILFDHLKISPKIIDEWG